MSNYSICYSSSLWNSSSTELHKISHILKNNLLASKGDFNWTPTTHKDGAVKAFRGFIFQTPLEHWEAVKVLPETRLAYKTEEKCYFLVELREYAEKDAPDFYPTLQNIVAQNYISFEASSLLLAPFKQSIEVYENLSPVERDFTSEILKAGLPIPEVESVNRPDAPLLNEIGPTISEIIRTTKGNIVTVAPTGGGKTSITADISLERVNSGLYTIICMPDKNKQNEFANDLLNRSGEDSLEDIYTEVINIDNETPHKRTRCIIIHSHYLKTKGFSKLSYAILKWADGKNPWVFLDEIDLILEKLTSSNNLRGRYIKKESKQGDYYEKFNMCPTRAWNQYSCDKCFLHKQADVNQRNIYKTVSVSQPQSISLNDFNTKFTDVMQTDALLNSSFYTRLEPHQNLTIDYLQGSINTDSGLSTGVSYLTLDAEEGDISSILEYQINNSFHPTLRQFHLGKLKKNGKVVYGDDFLPAFLQYQDKEIKKHLADGKIIDDKKMRKAFMDKVLEVIERPIVDGKEIDPTFSNHPCRSPILCMVGTTSLKYLAEKSERIICLTATTTEYLKNYLDFAIPGITFHEVTTVHKSTNNLLIITSPGKIKWHTSYIVGNEKKSTMDLLTKEIHKVAVTEEDSTYNKCLVFTPFKAENKEFYKYKDISVYDSSGEHVTVSALRDSNFYNTMVTHGRGSLGRAVNLGEYSSVITSMEFYKPMHAYNYSPVDSKKLEDVRDEERKTLMFQAIGRILRKPHRKVGNNKYEELDKGLNKVIFITEVDEDLGKEVQERLKNLVNKEIYSIHIEPFATKPLELETIFEMMTSFINNPQPPTIPKPKYYPWHVSKRDPYNLNYYVNKPKEWEIVKKRVLGQKPRVDKIYQLHSEIPLFKKFRDMERSKKYIRKLTDEEKEALKTAHTTYWAGK